MPATRSDPQRKRTKFLRSGSYWKEFHAARAARAAGELVAPPNWNAPVYHPLSDADKIYTFVPGRARPIVRAAGTPMPRPRPSQGPIDKKPKSGEKPAQGSNSIIACREREDQKLLAALAQRRTLASAPKTVKGSSAQNRGDRTPRDQTHVA